MIELLPDSPFTLRDVMSLNITRYAVSKMVNEGFVVKLGHGLYKKTSNRRVDTDYDSSMLEKVFARSRGEGCICLWSALEFYDLVDEFVEQAWIYIPYEKNIRVSEARPIRKRKLDLSVGVSDYESFKITTLERTLIDCFLSKKHISLRDSLEMCKRAISLKKTNIKKLVDMAKAMDCYNQVSEYLGLL